MRWWAWLSIVILVIIAIGGGYLYSSIREIRTEKLTDDLYVLFGMGGNVAVLNTEEGTVIVDSMTFRMQGERIIELASELTGKPVIAVINTHYHSDHTHGNPAFPEGIRVIATERTLHHLKQTDHEYFSGTEFALPNETFSTDYELEFGNKLLRLIALGRGHTDGDLVVLFQTEGVIHMGDLLFNGHYPNIDLEAGGSIVDWPATLENTLGLVFDRVIPGHGPITDKEGIRQFQRFMRELANIGRLALENATSLEDTLANTELLEDESYEEIRMIVPVGLDRDFVITRAWEEATGSYDRRL
ncbi:MAG: MBL fold metallo-hydrolase [Pseudomonadales bacterium]|nr:MBL fold metallo-hydrolase [Pseudomonadales bacterium]